MEIKALNQYQDHIRNAIEYSVHCLEINKNLNDTIQWLNQAMTQPTVVLVNQDRDHMYTLQQMMYRYYSIRRSRLIDHQIELTGAILDDFTNSRLLIAKLDMWLDGWHVIFK